MFSSIRKGIVLLVSVAVLVLFGCGDSDEDKRKESQSLLASDKGILKYVPADSPYLLGLLEPFPDDIVDKFLPMMDDGLKAYRDMVGVAMKQGKYGKKDGKKDSKPKAMSPKEIALMEELQNLLSVDGFNGIGVTRKSLFAVYGNGLRPVARLTLTDGGLMEAAIARIEKKSGTAMATSKVAGQTYRYMDEAEQRVIVAVIDDELVLSMVPVSASETELKNTLGLTLPGKSIADSGRLTDLAKKYGYLPQYLGLLDVNALADTLLNDDGQDTQKLLAAFDMDGGEPSADCKAEIREIAAVVPRIHAGYTHLAPERMDMTLVTEVREDLAAGLMKLVSPVPGMGADTGGLMSFGMSFNLLAMREFYSAQLDAIEADPYKCSAFAGINAGVGAAKGVLQQPIPPMVYNFKGMFVALDELVGLDLSDPKNPTPPTSVDGRMLLAIDNAPSLLVMAQSFLPDLANLDLKPDGKVTKLESQALPNVGGVVHVAMAENAIAFSMGDGMQSGLGDMLKAKPAVPSPAFSLNYDYARYIKFIGTVIAAADSGKGQDAQEKEMMAAASKLMAAYEGLQGRVSTSVLLTERGVEIPVSTEFN